MTQLSPLIGELERLYGVLAGRDVWNAKERYRLEQPPVITVASRGRKRTVTGWYVPAVWSDMTDDVLAGLTNDGAPSVQTKRAEIVLASELLAEPPARIVAELIRQMHVHANPGINPAGFYYPERWQRYAERFNCSAKVNPEQPSRGWSMWEPTDEFVRNITPLMHAEVFDMFRHGEAARAESTYRWATWSCDCGYKVHAGRKFAAHCDTCGGAFVVVKPAAGRTVDDGTV